MLCDWVDVHGLELLDEGGRELLDIDAICTTAWEELLVVYNPHFTTGLFSILSEQTNKIGITCSCALQLFRGFCPQILTNLRL